MDAKRRIVQMSWTVVVPPRLYLHSTRYLSIHETYQEQSRINLTIFESGGVPQCVFGRGYDFVERRCFVEGFW